MFASRANLAIVRKAYRSLIDDPEADGMSYDEQVKIVTTYRRQYFAICLVLMSLFTRGAALDFLFLMTAILDARGLSNRGLHLNAQLGIGMSRSTYLRKLVESESNIDERLRSDQFDNHMALSLYSLRVLSPLLTRRRVSSISERG